MGGGGESAGGCKNSIFEDCGWGCYPSETF